jgi:hypothetical protein
MATLLVICPAFQQVALAEQTAHIVSTEDLRAAVSAQFAQRTSDIQEITNLLHHETIQKRVGKLANLAKIEKKLAHLDDETLRQLAAQSHKINDQLQGGLSIVILLAIIVVAVALIIILATGDDDEVSIQ